MPLMREPLRAFRFLLAGALLLAATGAARAQVNPAEIPNPKLKAAEREYFKQLKALNRAIATTKFPFPLQLSRYAGLEPAKDVPVDTRGIEFVKFHERLVLKVTGNYGAAYNANALSPNQRASRVFQEVVAPILGVVRAQVPSDVACDAVGFEIAYHVRRQEKSADFEGKEILVVVFDKPDAFDYPAAPDDNTRQEILNRSEVYLDGNAFGLALGARDPLDLEALDRSPGHSDQPSREQASSAETANAGARLALVNPALLPDSGRNAGRASAPPAVASAGSPGAGDASQPAAAPSPAATAADAERLQSQFQSQLEAFGKEGVTKFHLVDYAPPSFVVFQDRIYLQLTMRNPLHFERDQGSIYKRAAQSFDLFLAPELRDFLEKIPQGAQFDGLDITVLNELAGKPKPSSEAIEFICPLPALRQFADARITNQELINQSVVLVNGVRIALNLQLVE